MKSKELGPYAGQVARITRGKTRGGLTSIEVGLALDAPPTVSGVYWRGGTSPAAIGETKRCLAVMGITYPDLVLTRRPFLVQLIEVECSLEETHGKAGVFRTFVGEILETKWDSGSV